jgi:hypothetical protein
MSDTSLIIGCLNIYIPTQIKYIFIFALSNVLLRKGHIISGKKSKITIFTNYYLVLTLPQNLVPHAAFFCGEIRHSAPNYVW